MRALESGRLSITILCSPFLHPYSQRDTDREVQEVDKVIFLIQTCRRPLSLLYRQPQVLVYIVYIDHNWFTMMTIPIPVFMWRLVAVSLVGEIAACGKT